MDHPVVRRVVHGASLRALAIWSLAAVGASLFAPARIGAWLQLALVAYAALCALSLLVPPYKSEFCADLLPTARGYVLITGCTNGIGHDMAHLFAARGYSLLLVARDSKALATLCKDLSSQHARISIESIVQDLADAQATEKVLEQMEKKGFDVSGGSEGGGSSDNSSKFVDILINNAGFALIDDFLSSPIAVLRSMILLHNVTISSMTHALLPGMLKRRRGRVVIVSSMIAHLPSPRGAMYAATKAFLTSLTQSLQYELGLAIDALHRSSPSTPSSPPNLSLCLVTPGPTATNFAAASKADQAWIFRMPGLSDSSEQVAGQIVRQVIAGRAHIQIGYFNLLTIKLLPLLPWKLGAFISFVLWGKGDFRKDFMAAR